MKLFFIFLSFFYFFCSPIFSQVQLGEGNAEPGVQIPSGGSSPESQANSSQGTLPLGALSDPEELALIPDLDEEMQVLKLRDHDTNMILDLIQKITGRYILRPQNLPAVKITFDSMNSLTKRETLQALESLLAMNGIGITKMDDLFFKAVPACVRVREFMLRCFTCNMPLR